MARAIETMSVTLGVSLTISGRDVAARTAAVTWWARPASTPNIIPLAPTFGHEMLSSMPAMLGADSSRVTTSM